MSIGVLIVGLGQIGMGYDFELDPKDYVYSHARAFSLHPEFHLVGGVDPDEKQRHGFVIGYRSAAFVDVETALTGAGRWTQRKIWNSSSRFMTDWVQTVILLGVRSLLYWIRSRC